MNIVLLVDSVHLPVGILPPYYLTAVSLHHSLRSNLPPSPPLCSMASSAVWPLMLTSSMYRFVNTIMKSVNTLVVDSS